MEGVLASHVYALTRKVNPSLVAGSPYIIAS